MGTRGGGTSRVPRVVGVRGRGSDTAVAAGAAGAADWGVRRLGAGGPRLSVAVGPGTQRVVVEVVRDVGGRLAGLLESGASWAAGAAGAVNKGVGELHVSRVRRLVERAT